MYRFHQCFRNIYHVPSFQKIVKSHNIVALQCSYRFYSGYCPTPPKPPKPTVEHSLPRSQKPNQMSQLPTPCSSWEEETETRRIKYRNKSIAGLFALGISLTVLYSVIRTTKEHPEKKKKVDEEQQTDALPPVIEGGGGGEPPKICTKSKRRVIRSPETSDEIPTEVPYLLIGGGTASFSAFRAIKSADPLAKVLVIGDEEHYPYMRPPLSKEIWFNENRDTMHRLQFKQWNGTERSLFYEPDDFYVNCNELLDASNGGVAVARGWSINKVDPKEKIAYLEDGKQIKYNKCLIATGASPKNLSVLCDAPPQIQKKVTLYRGIPDFADLEYFCNKGGSIAIVGGGFLGSELSCALARYGQNKNVKVYQVFREEGNMQKILPEYLCHWTTEKVKAEGVTVITNSDVQDVQLGGNGKLNVVLGSGKSFEVDHLVVAIGVKPNIEIAEASELEVDNELGGILVNTELEARSHLYAAGDCACFYDTKLGRRRVEHHDHAVVSGRLAGENMTGAENPYLHQSMFWSDLGPEIGYEAIGIIDSRLPTVGVFMKLETPPPSPPGENEPSSGLSIESDSEEKDPCDCAAPAQPFSITTADNVAKNVDAAKLVDNDDCSDFVKGIIFYLQDEIVVGIVLWNVFSRMSIARQIIREHKKYDDFNELAKLFTIHEE